MDGTFLSVAVCSGVIVGTGVPDRPFRSVQIVVSAKDGTFLSVATEKYPKDRDLRKNQGFPLKILFLFMNTGYVGLIAV